MTHAVLGDALRRVCAGQCVIDPAIVAQLLSRSRERGPLDELTEREREILSLMAEGHSNHSICGRLVISPRTVESHVRSVFMKLGLAESARQQPPRPRSPYLPASLTRDRES